MAIVYECPYELWDYDSGNCLSVYRTRQEAERERDAILAKYGHNLPESRVMIYCDGEDERAAECVGGGGAMKGKWVTVGPTAQPYCEVVVDDSGMVYISVQSGAVRTSDYLDARDAERVGQAIVDAARTALGAHGEGE